ncbi:uncharacterized protein EV154DRAFT_599200 [Mucor mucedo]|uniref:uncharacterized protein n=1 Tax=Mucor mucedo TaxID=29922 RepID=UPI00221F7C82|nr:uncharacterized protein EV154DRAFT_599200 [Mucor mucedo]KAI7895609.1 hypothetical protein EV154DRAFT_599200 [Mucor mucedo]
MDLSICLYCEKHLIEENISFCSTSCETNEASKPNYYPSRLLSSRPTSCASYEIAYHRRLSFSSTFYHQPLSSSSSSLSSISLDAVPKQQLSSSYLLTNSSILLHQRIADPKNYHQNVYSTFFFN